MASEHNSADESAQDDTLFNQLALPEAVQRAVADRGYTVATPIQAAIIPPILEGHDVIGQAQTGTGKTAAFALPLLAKLDPSQKTPQVLVLAPTRELAGQVAEACQDYGKHMKGMKIAAVYGGAGYGEQLANLRRGAQIIVGTPGRVIDHVKRGSLDLKDLRCLVLDEADEMLRMGFIEDVEWVLSQTPEQRQVALFSATMPREIRKIASRYLNDPTEINIAAKTATASTVRARYWYVRGINKYDACARVIEGEETDGVIVFTRTKHGSVEVAEGLQQRGISASALNGDMAQAQRERTVNQLKSGKLKVLVATDVAARGLDVERISHVINFDIPDNSETYVHRIGRTGRAGRSGEAILFIHPRDKRSLRDIERRTGQVIEEMILPDIKDINKQRIAAFGEKVVKAAEGNLKEHEKIVADILEQHDIDPIQLSAALASMVHGDRPLLLRAEAPQKLSKAHHHDNTSHREPGQRRGRDDFNSGGGNRHDDSDKDYYRLDVGKVHGTRPGMIVGAIANELDISGRDIGHIEIHHAYTTVALPNNLPAELKQALRRIFVSSRPLKAELLESPPNHNAPRHKHTHKGKAKPYTKEKNYAKSKKPKNRAGRAIDRERKRNSGKKAHRGKSAHAD